MIDLDGRIIKYFDFYSVLDEETMCPVFTFINKKNREIKSFKISRVDVSNNCGKYLDMVNELLSIIRDEKLDELGL